MSRVIPPSFHLGQKLRKRPGASTPCASQPLRHHSHHQGAHTMTFGRRISFALPPQQRQLEEDERESVCKRGKRSMRGEGGYLLKDRDIVIFTKGCERKRVQERNNKHERRMRLIHRKTEVTIPSSAAPSSRMTRPLHERLGRELEMKMEKVEDRRGLWNASSSPNGFYQTGQTLYISGTGGQAGGLDDYTCYFVSEMFRTPRNRKCDQEIGHITRNNQIGQSWFSHQP